MTNIFFKIKNGILYFISSVFVIIGIIILSDFGLNKIVGFSVNGFVGVQQEVKQNNNNILYKYLKNKYLKNKYLKDEENKKIIENKKEEIIDKTFELQKQENIGLYVISVIDGDTIKVFYNGEERSIRLIGIDAPESYITRLGYIECYGIESKNYLKDLIENKEIKIEFDETQGKEDKYNRILAYVFYNNENINNKLIQEGYGFEYTYNTKYKYHEQFLNSQTQAKEGKKGLWSNETCNGNRKISNNSSNTDFKLDLINITIDSTYSQNKIDQNKNIGFSCEKKKYCKYMTSCEEATYHYKICGDETLDGDKDGIPCENLCFRK